MYFWEKEFYIGKMDFCRVKVSGDFGGLHRLCIKHKEAPTQPSPGVPGEGKEKALADAGMAEEKYSPRSYTHGSDIIPSSPTHLR